MVYLTGDTHGELDRFKHGRLRWLGKRDIVVVLGDFGFVWDGSKEEQKKLDWLRKRPYTLLFLDGAHENYDLLAQYPVEERFGGRSRLWAAMCTMSAWQRAGAGGKEISLFWRHREPRQGRAGGRIQLVAAGDAQR